MIYLFIQHKFMNLFAKHAFQQILLESLRGPMVRDGETTGVEADTVHALRGLRVD